jgi:hypothetical protein
VTAIAVAGREAVIAQVPPSQTLVVQDGERYAFPDLASWRPDYVPPTDDPEPDPLGYRDGGRPSLYRTLMAPGDLILLCSSNVGRMLSTGAPDEPILSPDLDATLDRIGRLVAEHGLDDAFAAAVRIDQSSRKSFGRSARRCRLPVPSRRPLTARQGSIRIHRIGERRRVW